MERILSQHYPLLRATFREPVVPVPAPADPIPETTHDPPTVDPLPRSPGQAERSRHFHREKKLAQFQEVKRLAAQGMGIREIRRSIHLSRERIRKYLQNEELPEYTRRKKPTQLDPYWEDVQQRWQDGCRNGFQLWREIQAKGYPGGYGSFARKIRSLRERMPPMRKTNSRAKRAKSLPVASPRPPSPRQVTWWFARPPDKLDEDEGKNLHKLLEQSSDLQQVYDLVQEFLVIIHERKKEVLASWLERAKHTSIVELKYFALGLENDLAAVEAALTYQWSNGPVEGNNNRLKMIKRQMYGRAGFDLLRLRVLYA